MSEIIVLVIFLFFAVCGVSTICAKLWLFLVRPQHRRCSISVVHIDGEENDDNLVYALEKYRWYGKDYADYIIFVTNSELSKRAAFYISQYKNVYCVNEERLGTLIKKLREEKYERS